MCQRNSKNFKNIQHSYVHGISTDTRTPQTAEATTALSAANA